MDFVTAWKASSIVLTGAFGVLGLLTDFRDTGSRKVTRWGKVSLAGIVISTLLGTIAQLKESSDDATKTFLATQKTVRMLDDLDRSLSPIQGAEVRIDFQGACSLPLLVVPCKKIRVTNNYHLRDFPARQVLGKTRFDYAIDILRPREVHKSTSEIIASMPANFTEKAPAASGASSHPPAHADAAPR